MPVILWGKRLSRLHEEVEALRAARDGWKRSCIESRARLAEANRSIPGLERRVEALEAENSRLSLALQVELERKAPPPSDNWPGVFVAEPSVYGVPEIRTVTGANR
jgi:hypothetical protein